jgi:hypothetical protein
VPGTTRDAAAIASVPSQLTKQVSVALTRVVRNINPTVGKASREPRQQRAIKHGRTAH